MEMILEKLDLVMPNGSLNQGLPLVAVFVVTYNHEDFIANAVQSILAQKTSFRFQIFIGEDGSKDQTGEICQRLADLFPNEITLFRRQKNIGIFENANLLFQACLSSGAKYIAMLEGDDAWLGHEKLQRQVNYLEENPDCAGSFHNTEFLFNNGDRKTIYKKLPERMNLSDVLGKYAPFHTTSFVFRAQHFCRPSWFKEIHSVDLAMYMWHAQFGYFKGFPEVWSCYRIHDAGITAREDHKSEFDQKRFLLHVMMSGKISPSFQKKSSELVQYYRSQLRSQDVPDIGKILFFDSTNCFQSRVFKMSLNAAILPFVVSQNAWNGFFCRFSLNGIRRLNFWKLRFYYRAHWKGIRSVVFSNHNDLRIFKEYFRHLPFPYLIIGNSENTETETNEHNFYFSKDVEDSDLLPVANAMNHWLNDWKNDK